MNKDVTCGTVDLTCEDLDWALEWCGVTLRFLATPGHSPGSICLSAKGMLFTGDCLLPGGRRVTRIPGGDSGALEKSLRMLATNFDEETLVYPGHGEPFKLKEANLRRA